MFRLVRELIRLYRWQLAVILLAMLVETAASLAGPWSLKIIISSNEAHKNAFTHVRASSHCFCEPPSVS